jgi:hypothetical protein
LLSIEDIDQRTHAARNAKQIRAAYLVGSLSTVWFVRRVAGFGG